MIFWTLSATASVIIWIYLTWLHKKFWQLGERLTPSPVPVRWPHVIALIPARNEAQCIANTITGLARSDYPGKLAATLIDDHSNDGTPELARLTATNNNFQSDLAIISAPALESGWTGKLWALNAGYKSIQSAAPDYILLLDADIKLDASTLRLLVSKAEAENRALVSLMARLDSSGFWGSLLIPAFIYFFQKLYPFPAVNDATMRTAAAAGGCALIRWKILKEIHGFSKFKGEIIDDCALAKQVKGIPTQHSIWLGLADKEAISTRDNRSISTIWKMVERTAFTQLNYSWLYLVGTVAGMFLLYLMPIIAIVVAIIQSNEILGIAGVLAYALMCWTFMPTLRLYDQPAKNCTLLPLAALLYSTMTITSAVKHLIGAGSAWKGRTYPK